MYSIVAICWRMSPIYKIKPFFIIHTKAFSIFLPRAVTENDHIIKIHFNKRWKVTFKNLSEVTTNLVQKYAIVKHTLTRSCPIHVSGRKRFPIIIMYIHTQHARYNPIHSDQNVHRIPILQYYWNNEQFNLHMIIKLYNVIFIFIKKRRGPKVLNHSPGYNYKTFTYI